MIETTSEVYFKPLHVGTRGRAGIKLDRVGDADLKMYINIAWELIAPKRLRTQRDTASSGESLA